MFKGTKGEWKVGEIDKTKVWSEENGKRGVVSWGTNEAHNSHFHLDKDHQTHVYNAELIANSGTTINKCGFFPSELLEQRDDLLEALINLINIDPLDIEGVFKAESKALKLINNLK